MIMIQMRKCQHCNGTGVEIDQRALSMDLRQLRLRSGKTQREVARRLGISAMYLSDLENGRRAWSTDRIAQFKKATA